MTVEFKRVWRRIQRHEGETFRQIRGGKFKYEVVGNNVVLDRTNRVLHISKFEKAYELVPLENTKPVQHLQGPSYLYAILMDDRIRQNDW